MSTHRRNSSWSKSPSCNVIQYVMQGEPNSFDFRIFIQEKGAAFQCPVHNAACKAASMSQTQMTIGQPWTQINQRHLIQATSYHPCTQAFR